MVDTDPANGSPEDAQPNVDGVQAPSAPHSPPAPAVSQAISPLTSKEMAVPAEQVRKAKKSLILFGGAAYAAYVVMGLALMSLLPNPDGNFTELVPFGLGLAALGAVTFVVVGLFLFKRISKADVAIVNRQRSLLKTVIVLAPGLLFSGVLSVMILRQPAMSIDIVSPAKLEDMVAPVAVTLSVEKAVEGIRKRTGLTPILYSWDTNGDQKEDTRTVEPTTQIVYQRQGSYPAIVSIQFSDHSVQRIGRRVQILYAVFSVTPPVPIVEKQVRFSVAGLIPDIKQLKEVQWDLNGDGTADKVTKTADIVNTYYTVERVKVSAAVLFLNNTQQTYTRYIDVSQQPPLPFPVRLIAEPKNLVGPAPFGAIFRIETDEPLKEVGWSFGDTKEEKGADLRRVSHLFDTPGIYPVTVQVRSGSGKIAELTSIVKVTETLTLPDLQFDGKPDVTNNSIEGVVPLTVQITPKTAVPLIEFQWEGSDDIAIQPTGTTMNAVFRREGSYTLTLIAQDPEGKALRLLIKVQVNPPGAEPAIAADPDGGVAPLNVVFDASDTFIPPGQKIAGFKWLYGDEDAQNVNPELGAARVEHTYQKPGEYTVSLSVVMANGKQFTAKHTIVVRRPVLTACIIASRLKVEVNKGVQFDASCSSGSPVSYLWDVRYDAKSDTPVGQSPEMQYVHVFSTAGNYTVTLTIRDTFGNLDKKTLSISVEEPSQ